MSAKSKLASILIGTALVGGSIASVQASPIVDAQSDQIMMGSKDKGDAKCGSGKCGGQKDKDKDKDKGDAKCGSGKCGGSK